MIYKTYDELITLETYEERLRYLMTNSAIGAETFGCSRYLNQAFYSSREWKDMKSKIVLRDNGCDMALPGYTIMSNAVLHHINPITIEDILERTPALFDPNNIVLVSSDTHRLIHYMNKNNQVLDPIPKEREEFDTIPWKRRIS